MEENFGSPYYHIHRADLHQLLYDLASSSPLLTLRLSSNVVSADPSLPSVTLASGEVVKADLIIGADGVKSSLREIVLGAPVKAVATGDAVYRALVPTSEMVKDPELKPLVDNPEMTGWMGPSKHIMGYNINTLMYNRNHGISSVLAREGTIQPCSCTPGRRLRRVMDRGGQRGEDEGRLRRLGLKDSENA